MDHIDLQILKTARDWRAAGRRAVLGTVTKTWDAAPRPAGSVIAFSGDGDVAGSVAGRAIEDDLAAKVRAGSLAVDVPALLRYGDSADEAARFGLAAGVLIELVLEPISMVSQLDGLLARLARGERVRRTLDLEDGSVMLSPAGPRNDFQIGGGLLITTHVPAG